MSLLLERLESSARTCREPGRSRRNPPHADLARADAYSAAGAGAADPGYEQSWILGVDAAPGQIATDIHKTQAGPVQ